MKTKKRGPGRPPKKRRGRPKGSRNKWRIEDAVKNNLLLQKITENNPWKVVNEEQPIFLKSRLDESMVRLESAIAEAISKIKECI